MQSCNGFEHECSKLDTRVLSIAVTIPRDILALFDKKVVERKVKNRSVATKEAMTCWIYREDDNCKECPYYDEENKKDG